MDYCAVGLRTHRNFFVWLAVREAAGKAGEREKRAIGKSGGSVAK